MAVAFLASSNATASSAAGASNLTTSPNVTVSGSNVYLIGYAGTGDNTPGGTPTAFKWGGSSGESLTQIGTTQTFATNFDHSAWGKTGATAQTAATYCAWSGAVSETALAMLVYTGVDQTTPTGTPVYQTGHSASPSVTVTTVSGDVVIGLLWCGSGGGVPTVTSSQTMRESIADVGGAIYEAMYLLETTASGTSTTISASVAGGSAVDWGFIAFTLKAAAAGTTVNTSAGALALTGAAPTAVKSAKVFGAAGALALGSTAPTVTTGGSVSVPTSAGALAIGANAPTVVAGGHVNVTTAAGALSLAGVSPQVTYQAPAPGTGALTLTGNAPTVTVGAAVTVNAGVGALVIAANAPTITKSARVYPPAGALTLTGQAPVITVGSAISVPTAAGALSIGANAPTVVKSARVFADVGALSLAGQAPTVTTSAKVTSDSGALSITGYAPTLTIPSSASITTGTGSLSLAGQAPSIPAKRATGAGKSTSRRRRVVIGERVYSVNERDIPALLEAELMDRTPPKTAEVVSGPKPKKRAKPVVKTAEEVRVAYERVREEVQAQPDSAWLVQALEAVAVRALERITDEEEALMLLVA